jgi:hypothetical protein
MELKCNKTHTTALWDARSSGSANAMQQCRWIPTFQRTCCFHLQDECRSGDNVVRLYRQVGKVTQISRRGGQGIENTIPTGPDWATPHCLPWIWGTIFLATYPLNWPYHHTIYFKLEDEDRGYYQSDLFTKLPANDWPNPIIDTAIISYDLKLSRQMNGRPAK